MKRKLLLCLLTMCFLVGLLAFPAAAEELTLENGLSYTSDGTAVTITGYTGEAAEVIIPEVIAVPNPTEEEPDATLELPVTAIGKSAFYGKSALTSVVIPDSVTVMGESVFLNCENLEQVTLPEGLTVIPASTFLGCCKLSQINIPENLEFIGAEAFLYCDGLSTMILPDTLKVIGDSAFKESSLTEIVIPDGTAIGNDVLAWCDKLVSVTLPADLTELPQNTFLGCSSLTEISLPEGLEEIGYQAFSSCSALTRVVLPESVETIGGSAFSHCTALTEAVLSDSLKEIGTCAFQGTALTDVVLPEGLQTIGDKAFSFSGLKSVTVPDSVTSLGDEAFAECSALTYAKIGDGVTEIASGTFGNCTGLTELHIGNSVTEIDAALWAKSPLQIVEFGTGITEAYSTIPATWFKDSKTLQQLTMHGKVESVADYAFSGCSALKQVIFTETVELNVGQFGFKECTALESLLRIADEPTDEAYYSTIYLHTVGDNGFVDCSSLKNVDIAAGGNLGIRSFAGCDSLTELNVRSSATIGEEAFVLCSNLETVYLHTRNIGTGAFKSCEKLLSAGPAYADGDYNVRYWFTDYLGSEMSYFTYLETLVVGEGISQLHSEALDGCLYLQEVHLPSTLTRIYYNAFSSKGSLTKVTIPTIGDWLEIDFDNTESNPLSFGAGLYVDDELVVDVVIPGTVTDVGSYNFAGYEKLKSLTMESGVKTIGFCAFSGCKNLTSVTFADTLTTMEEAVFSGCIKIKTIVLPESLLSVPAETFQGCTSLQEVQMPKYLGTIGRYAFEGCTKLKTVQLPDYLTEIGYGAFSECSSLSAITLPSVMHTIDGNAFYGCSALESIVLPDKILNLSEGVFCNCTALTDVTLPAKLLSIGQNAFYNCSALTGITIPDTVKQMESGAFAHTGLKSVDLPVNLTELPNDCFYSCTSLSSVTLPENLTAIGNDAFSRTQLSEVVLPETVTEIGNSAYSSCFALTSVILPEGLETLGENAFNSCSALKELTLPENCAVGEYAIRDSAVQTLYVPAGIQTVPHSLWCTSVETVIFTGDMPELNAKTFFYAENIGREMNIAALYPQGNETYTEDNMVNYGAGSIEWYPYDENGVIAGGESDGVHWSVIGDKLTVWGSGSTEALYDTNLMPHEAYPWYRLRSHIETAEIQSGITGLYDQTLSGLANLTEVSLPEGLTHMGNNLFTDSGLTEVTIPSTVTSWGNSEYSSTIYTFSYAPQLKSITFAEGMTQLPKYLFNFSTNYVENVTLPSTMETINFAFNGAQALKSINLPEGLLYMENAFQNCDSLTEVTIPSTVTNYAHAFSSCDNLTTVTILPTDDEVANYDAFMDCTSLTTVNLPEGLPRISGYMFYHCSALKEIRIPDTVTSIEHNSFEGCTALTGINLPENLTIIHSQAFSGCTSLKSLELPAKIQSIGDGAFENCSALESVSVPVSQNLSTAAGAFRNCIKLKTVDFGPGLINLDDTTFENCVALTQITLPHTLKSLNAQPFYRCTNLKTITFLGDAPHIGESDLKDLTLTAYYPKTNTSWDSFDFGNYGGTVTWKALASDCTEHTYCDWGTIKPATCTEDGTSRQTCTACGVYREKSIPATGHTKGTLQEKVEVNGCQEGYSAYICKTCDSWFRTDIVPGQPHEWGNWFSYDGDCESGCFIARHCNVCGTEESKYIEPTEHTWGAWTEYEPQCETSVWPSRHCSVCGMDEMMEVLPVGHTWGKWTTEFEANCHMEGNQYRNCTKCGAHEEQMIPALSHSYGNWTVNMQPGCTHDGDQYRECANCGEKIWDNVPSTGHSYTQTVIKANCQQGGYILHECSKCGDRYETDHKPSTDHTYKTTVHPATCQEWGYTHYQCTVCGYGYDGDQTEQLPHTFGQWIIVQQPDHTHNGLKERVCTSCGNAKESEEIPPLADDQPYNPFVDVAQGKFYYNAVLWAAETGVTTGITATTFEPGKTCTRAQVVTFLWRAAGSPEPTSTKNPFVDVVEGKFYYKAVLWAVENGITNGVDATHFGTNDECTRGHVATFLWRTLNKPAASGGNPFSDVQKGKFYYDAVLWAAETGVTTGTAPGKFDPAGTCTRGQIVTFLYRALGSK